MSSPTPILPLHIDSTMISAFRSCNRKFFHEFVLGLRMSAKSIDLHAGGCFAKALEVYYNSFFVDKLSPRECLLRAEAAFTFEWGDFTIPPGKESTTKTFTNMWRSVVKYLNDFPPDTDLVQPYFVSGLPTFEFTFAIPLTHETTGYDFPLHPSGEPFIYSGRFDMLGQREGRPVIRDEKTTAREPSNWGRQFDLRSQFLGYCWACQSMGLDVKTAIVRGVIIHKDETIVREMMKVYEPHLIDRWLYQLYRSVSEIRRSWDENYFNYDFAEACTAYGNCSFIDLCKTKNPESFYSTYKVVRWNPLTRENLTLTPEKE